jgi:hypothetical protein
MRIPMEALQCVVYLGKYVGNQKCFAGTGFIVCVNEKDGEQEIRVSYLVTARHVVKQIQGNAFVVRANMRGGVAEDFEVNYTADGEVKWYRHPTDQTADVAITPITPEMFKGTELKAIQENTILARGAAQAHGIGPGDEVYIVGLFTHHTGKSRNSPIVRVGNIAMIPIDRVSVRGLGEVEGYLIEARSIGGLSGSPVFVHPTVNLPGLFKWGTNQPATAVAMDDALYLLGLMCGHYDVDLHSVDGTPIGGPRQGDNVNVGVGIVIPSYKILEIIQSAPASCARRRCLQEPA